MLLALPDELLELIVSSISSERTLCNLCRVNRRLSNIAFDYLYRLNESETYFSVARGIWAAAETDAPQYERSELDHDRPDGSGRASQWEFRLLRLKDYPLMYAPFWAVAKGRLDTLKRAAAVGVKVDYFSLLLLAASRDSIGITAWLIDRSFFIGRLGSVYLHRLWATACAFGANDVIRLLANRYIQFPARRYQCLSELAKANNPATAFLLFDLGFGEGLTQLELDAALRTATKCSSPEVMRLLIDHGADVLATDGRGEAILREVVMNGDNTALLYHLVEDKGVDINTNLGRCTALSAAASSYSTAMIDALLDLGADVNLQVTGDVGLPLLCAVNAQRDRNAKLLLQRGADANQASESGATPLSEASGMTNVALVQVLLDHGADPNAPIDCECSPLIHACERGLLEVARALIDGGAKIHEASPSGELPILSACRSKNVSLLRMFQDELGINLADVRNRSGEGVVHVVAVESQNMLRDVLRLKTVDADATDNTGRTALHIAARFGTVNSVCTLLETGADPRKRDLFGGTALTAAARTGQVDTARLILEDYPEGVNDVDKFGRRPVDWAAKSGPPSLVHLLNEYQGAKYLDQEPQHFSGPLWSAFNKDAPFCDICMRVSSTTEKHWSCDTCNEGDFDTCRECFDLLKEIGVSPCLSPTHTEKDGSWQLHD